MERAMEGMSKREFKQEVAEMSMRDEMLFPPWTKFRKFGLPPWKLMLHIVIVFVLVIQAIMLFHICEEEARSAQNPLNNFFFPVTSDSSGQLYSIEEILSAFYSTRNLYYNFVNSSVAHFEYVHMPSGEIEPIVLAFHWNDKPAQSWQITQTPSRYFGPLDTLNLAKSQQILFNITSMEMSFRLINTVEELTRTVTIIYTVQAGLISVRMGAAKVERTAGWPNDKDGKRFAAFIAINVVLALLCGLSIFMHLRVIFRNVRLYRMAAKAWNAIPPERKALYTSHTHFHLSMFFEFFKLGGILLILGNAFLLLAAIRSVYDQYSFTYSLFYQICEGTGVLLTTLTLMRYFEFEDNFYIAYNTLALAFRQIIRSLISILPIFVGYVFIGTILFGDYCEHFRTFDATAITLFCIMNGDEIQATVRDLRENYPYIWMSEIFIYTFTSLFFLAILKLFIQIIRQGFSRVMKLRSSADSARNERRMQTKQDFLKLLDIVGQLDELNEPDNQNLAEDIPIQLLPSQLAWERVLERQYEWMKETEEAMLDLNSKYMYRLANKIVKQKRKKKERQRQQQQVQQQQQQD